MNTAAPLDAVVVPGCPVGEDGRLSPCLAERAAWAALLWEGGVAAHFIVSGAAVHSPFGEAEALAEGMATLGVPAERIELERHALHSDENMFLALLIADARGWRSLGVASQTLHARSCCLMLTGWGRSCVALDSDRGRAVARHRRAGEPLWSLRRPPVADWVPLREREERLAAQAGTRTRPPSYLRYLWFTWLRANGATWAPPAPSTIELLTLAELRAGRRPRRVRVEDPLIGHTRAAPDPEIYPW